MFVLIIKLLYCIKVFNQVLFAFYRDENGNPRTARDPNTGLPIKYDRQESTYVSSICIDPVVPFASVVIFYELSCSIKSPIH